MKKFFIMSVILTVCCFASLATAAAATNVPKGHWAYPAIQTLIRAGIVSESAGDTIWGDKIITRYEMAELVRQAAATSTKATFEQKALIEKLSVEFALELNNIDTPVAAPAKEQNSLKITGMLVSRYEWVQHPRVPSLADPTTDPARAGIADSTNTLRNSIWLFLDNQFDDKTYLHGLLQNETVSGRSTNAGINLLEGYAATKIRESELAVGRFFPAIGMGFFGSPWMDGARLTLGSDDDIKVRLFSVQLLSDPFAYGDSTYAMADARINVSKTATLSLGYVKDEPGTVHYPYAGVTGPFYKTRLYEDYAVGLEYKGMPNLNLKGEYAVNHSPWAKAMNDGNAKAYFTTLKYKGANPFVPGSFGLRLEYKYADPGFDALSYAAPFEWNGPLNWTQPPQGGYNDNIKGFEFGVEYTLVPRLLLDVRHNMLKTANGQPVASIDGNSYTHQDFTTAQLTYLF